MNQMILMAPNGTSEIDEQVEQTSNKETDSSSSSGKGKEIKIAARKGKTRPPLNFLSILKDANIQIDTSSPDKLCDLLYAGVFLISNTLKYFVDKKSNKNCFAIFPREFYICWGENSTYWKWTQEKETRGEEEDIVEVAELLEVCWLEVRGKIGTIDLSPGVVYEIVFVMRIWENLNNNERHISNYTLTLTIIPPRVKRLSRKECFKEKPVGPWFEIVAGEFIMSPENVGIMEFSIEEYTPTWKSGLILKCAIIRPKKD